ncbi:MAG: hypothetical protein BWZ08_02630 [candidate division BRC1 bacterium ADurb.BinA292]|nr:MAG: hypothetical protein BWZ08_02630 [candidate division BRC1 bacterium ADurb.BinA292]
MSGRVGEIFERQSPDWLLTLVGGVWGGLNR